MKAAAKGTAILTAITLAGCSMFGGEPPIPPVDHDKAYVPKFDPNYCNIPMQDGGTARYARHDVGKKTEEGDLIVVGIRIYNVRILADGSFLPDNDSLTKKDKENLRDWQDTAHTACETGERDDEMKAADKAAKNEAATHAAPGPGTEPAPALPAAAPTKGALTTPPVK